MKRTLYIIGVAAVWLASCTPQTPSDEYRILGTINEADGKEIYLAYIPEENCILTDTARIENGAFTFTGTLDGPYRPMVIYMGDYHDATNQRRCGVFIEPQEMTVRIDTARFDKPVITGSLIQAQIDSVQSTIDAIRKEASPLYKAIETERDEEKLNALCKQLEPYNERMTKVQLAFVKTHPDSFLSPIYLEGLISDMPYPEAQKLYDQLSDRVKQQGDVKVIEKMLKLMRDEQTEE